MGGGVRRERGWDGWSERPPPSSFVALALFTLSRETRRFTRSPSIDCRLIFPHVRLNRPIAAAWGVSSTKQNGVRGLPIYIYIHATSLLYLSSSQGDSEGSFLIRGREPDRFVMSDKINIPVSASLGHYRSFNETVNRPSPGRIPVDGVGDYVL